MSTARWFSSAKIVFKMPHDWSSKKSLKLLIIVKAKRRNGLCYIGLDTDQRKLVRPMLRKNTSCWFISKDPDLQIGEEYLFERRDPLYISYPHQEDNIFVKYIEPTGSVDVEQLYDILIDYSHPTVKEVFGNRDEFNGEYFVEHTRCPSAGIYKCKRKNLNIPYNADQHERKCEITEDGRKKPFSFRVTAVNDELPAVAFEDDVLVMLGLAKPYRGSSCQYNTKWRCYILVIGFVVRSTNIQQHSQSESQYGCQLRQSDGHEIVNTNGANLDAKACLPKAKKRKLETDYVS